MKYILIVAFVFSSSVHADTLLTQSEGGKVSIIQHLPDKECQKARNKLLRMDEISAEIESEKKACPKNMQAIKMFEYPIGCTKPDGTVIVWGGGHIVNQSDIISAECLK